jgi:tRNA(Ile)-lysidine synthase
LLQSQRVLVAVSGGQDSLCLIRLLLDLQPKWHWQLAIAHCNHRWRSDADANADFVCQLANGWHLPYYAATAGTALTSEAAARQWRYEALTQMALEQGYGCLATGHTSSDRAETLLYNLMRGSGADGLQALSWQRNLTPELQLVRPMLNITRAETAEFCHAANLTVWEDCTNDDWQYARNRIRQELLPYLQAHFNPQVEQALAQTAELLQAEVDYLEAATDELWQHVAVSDDPLIVNRRVLQTAPLALQRRVLRRWLCRVLSDAPRFDQIEKLIALIAAPNRSQTDPFPGGAVAQAQGDWIEIKMRNAEG